MTHFDMDYKEAYDDICQKLMSAYNTTSFIEVKKAIGQIHPELRESEDEMTYKRAIAILKQQRYYWSYDGPKDKCPPATLRKDLVKALDVAISYLEKQKEQKPVERYLDLTELLVPQRNIGQKLATDGWSIKDANFHSNLLYLMRENNSKEGWEGCYEWLEELPSRISLKQKPAEWSYPYGENETVDKLIAIAECLEMDGDCLFNGYSGTECGKFLRELARKQVECKPSEWSDEDDQLIGFIFDLLNSLVWRKEWAMDKKECLERLKSLRPSWKPSEWQMSMLLAVINDPNNAGSESCYLTLKSIYEQLKKL